ncbi:MAG: type IV secretion system protein [Alphaproteobacteria bacterium]|nr:type IV secretion system protein [Alphaproteobacteria bacterium]
MSTVTTPAVTLRCLILAGLAALLMAWALPGDALAQGPLTGELIGGREVPDDFKCREAAEAPFAMRITSCIRQMLWQSVLIYIQGIWPWTQAMMQLCLILALTFHGFRMSAGMLRNPWNDTFWLCFKIGTMYAIMYNYAVLYDYPYRIMDYLLYVATSAMPFNILQTTPGVESLLGQDPAVCAALDGADYDKLLVWKRFDCMMGMVMGFSATAGLGLIPLIVVFLLTGVGLFLIWPIVNFIIFMIEVSLKALLIYITALLHIAVLLMVLPFILPTILFKTTYDIFSKWVAEMFDAMVQPIFVFTFLSFMLLLLKDALNSFLIGLQQVLGGITGQQMITAPCETLVWNVSDEGTSCGASQDCTASLSPQANLCLHPTIRDSGEALANLLTDLLVLMMIVYLVALFFEHLASMASRLIRITGGNYFSFVNSITGGAGGNYAQLTKERARAAAAAAAAATRGGG